jgi:alcohol dehydrogenase (NADP+)
MEVEEKLQPERIMTVKNIKAFGTIAAENQLEPLNIQRRVVTSHDVEIEILYCGICHSDACRTK